MSFHYLNIKMIKSVNAGRNKKTNGETVLVEVTGDRAAAGYLSDCLLLFGLMLQKKSGGEKV